MRERGGAALGRALIATAALITGCAGPGQPTVGPTATTQAPLPTATAAPATDTPTAAPATAPPGLTGRLVYARFTEATHTFTGMFTSAPDASGVAEIPMPWTEGGARWSTSGEFLAVPTQLKDGRVGTAVLDASGAVVRVLEVSDDSLNLPCTIWSPDDKRLACEGWDDGDATRRGFYTVRSADGGDIKRLTTPPAGMGDSPGDWAPGGKIVFNRYTGDEPPGQLLIVPAGGGDPVALNTGRHDDEGRFSPDGTLVATGSGGVIVVFDLTGARVASVERNDAFLFGPAWSPDGAWLVYSAAPGGRPFSDLWISRPDGTDTAHVTRTSANEIDEDWGPDPD